MANGSILLTRAYALAPAKVSPFHRSLQSRRQVILVPVTGTVAISFLLKNCEIFGPALRQDSAGRVVSYPELGDFPLCFAASGLLWWADFPHKLL